LVCSFFKHAHHLVQLVTISLMHLAPWFANALKIATMKHKPAANCLLVQLLWPRRQIRAAQRANLLDAELPQPRHASSVSSSYSPHPHKIASTFLIDSRVYLRRRQTGHCSLCKLVQRTPPSLGFPLPKQPWAEARMMVPLVNVYGLSVVWYDNRLFMSDVAGITIESGKRWMHEEYRVC